jgi:hypothetical protein
MRVSFIIIHKVIVQCRQADDYQAYNDRNNQKREERQEVANDFE